MCLQVKIINTYEYFSDFYRLTDEETRKIWEESGDPDGPGGKDCFMGGFFFGGGGDPQILLHEQRKII